ncbi:hypothetical protein [Leifsonia sp. AG29]|uniref:hypothetical protein n=1 Tax=Leifsonia sp. AG29 TaxID=2598860 RepID=UPI0018EEF3DA|nr:hypothetical protein [Leifsonia sp. AG29]
MRGRGDLTLVVGLGHEASAAAAVLAMSAGAGAEVQPVGDRRGALAARADGVRREIPVVGVFALEAPNGIAAAAADLAAIAPDQVWAAVDVSRKHDDTTVWVRALDEVLAVDAVAASGAAATQTPETVHQLGLPVLWLDAPPSPSPVEQSLVAPSVRDPAAERATRDGSGRRGGARLWITAAQEQPRRIGWGRAGSDAEAR